MRFLVCDVLLNGAKLFSIGWFYLVDYNPDSQRNPIVASKTVDFSGYCAYKSRMKVGFPSIEVKKIKQDYC